MQLVLDQSVFGSANLAGRLLELLSLLAYGRHGLVLEETDTADQLLHFIDVFLNAELRQDYRELIEKFQVDSVWRSGSTPVVVKASDLAELLEDLRQPARV